MIRRKGGWDDNIYEYFIFHFNFRYISTDTLKELLQELDNKLTDEELTGIIEEVDTDGSGTLDFDGKYIGISYFSALIFQSLSK